MSIAEDVPPIPPQDPNSPRTVIFLFDGTGDQIDESCTNIVGFGQMLHNNPFENVKQDTNYPREHPNVKEVLSKRKQVVLYRPGIGTWNPATSVFYGKLSKTLDEALATNFKDHVLDAYKELMELYQEGDKICFFGFSRGAYTARALAGVIAMFGLLPPGSKAVEDIRKQYFDQSNVKWSPETKRLFKEQTQQFRENNPDSRDIFIEFVGVWDTVNSVGIFSGLRLPYTSSNWRVRKFRHAVALDERRARFDRSMWTHKKAENDPTKKLLMTDAVEVWFAGVHCDVGGGSVENGTKPNLANIPLRWMIRECFKTNPGILFIRNEIEKFGLNPSNLYPNVRPRPDISPLRPNDVIRTPAKPGWFSGWFKANSSPKESYPHLSEEEHDRQDALAPIYDMLEIKWYQWYALEVWPFKKWDQVKYEDSRVQNWWRGRDIHIHNPKVEDERPEESPLPKEFRVKVHRTVRTRMMAAHPSSMEGPYVPKATLGGQKFDINSEYIEWVD